MSGEGQGPLRGETELQRALESLRSRRVEPPSDLVDRAVLRAVQARAAAITAQQDHERSPLGRLATLRKPVFALGLVAAAAALAITGVRSYGERAASAATAASLASFDRPAHGTATATDTDADAAGPVPVRFVLPASGAREVAVAGEFNDWDASRTPLQDDDGDGVFHTTLPLPRGAYAYMFVVDGERWVTDPFADAYRDDGFGNRNAVLRIP